RIQPVSEPPVTITLLAQQAGLLVSLGEVRKAIDLLAEALNLARQGSDISYRYHQGSLNCALAGLFSHLRQIELAVAPYLESLRIAREIGSRQGEAAVLLALGTLCGRIREFSYEDLSIEHRLKLLQDIAAGSLSAHEDMNEEPSSESIDSTMRRRADQLGADLVERALEINHEIGDYESAAIALGNLSNFQKARGGPERIETLLRALGQLRERQGRTSSEAVMLANLGKAYLSVGGIAEARACLESSLGLSESVKEYEWAHDTAEELANTYLADGRPAEAVKYLCQAIDYTEAARRSLPLEDLTRVAFVRDKLRAYENLTILYAEMNRTEEAFDTVQRGKSRALLELSALGRIDPAVPVTPQLASLLEEEEKLLAQIQLHLNDRRRSGMAGVTNRSLDDLHAELDHLYGSLENLDPQYAAIRRGKPAGFRKIRDVLAKQNHPILLVDYFTAADNLLIFLARAEWPEPKYLKM